MPLFLINILTNISYQHFFLKNILENHQYLSQRNIFNLKKSIKDIYRIFINYFLAIVIVCLFLQGKSTTNNKGKYEQLRYINKLLYNMGLGFFSSIKLKSGIPSFIKMQYMLPGGSRPHENPMRASLSTFRPC